MTKKEQWGWNHGPWDLYVVESGSHSVGADLAECEVQRVHGCHKVTIFPLELVTDENARERERFWEMVLSPTLNQKTPYAGVNRLTWEFLTSERIESPKKKPLRVAQSL